MQQLAITIAVSFLLLLTIIESSVTPFITLQVFQLQFVLIAPVYFFLTLFLKSEPFFLTAEDACWSARSIRVFISVSAEFLNDVYIYFFESPF
jgi:hypothetical protein